MTSKNKKNAGTKNNPYPLSGSANNNDDTATENGHLSFSEPPASERRGNSPSENPPYHHDTDYEEQPPATSSKSNAPTLSTNGETAVSDAAPSKAGTSATAGGGISSSGGGEGSTFSSPAPSVRSLTTTLTTIQSAAPSTHLYAAQNANPNAGVAHVNPAQPGHSQQSSVQFSHQFPDSPATAVPSHLAPNGHPTTYNTATANNLLTDNASILTLASSSKRRRRNSLDTNASVRALAPSSIFGGSRESLPLSLLSGNVEPSNASTTNASGVLNNRPALGGIASSERISIYSSSGVAPSSSGANANAGASGSGDRGSYYANKQGGGISGTGAGDTGSVRSGLHGRNDSYAGSTNGGISSPLNSPVPGVGSTSGRVSRRGSGWGEVTGDDEDDDDNDGSDEKGKKKEEIDGEGTKENKKENESYNPDRRGTGVNRDEVDRKCDA